MRWLPGTIIAAVTASAASWNAGAEAPSQAGPWFPEWSAPYCTISTGNPKELALSIWYVPGSSGVEIYFTGGSLAQVPRMSGNVGPMRLGPTEALVQMAAEMRAIPITGLATPAESHVVGYAMTRDDFFGNFANSNELLVREGDTPVGMRYGGAKEAMTALQRCVDTKLKEWDVDSVALATLRRLPQLHLNSWVNYSDYPKDALAQKQDGTVVARLTTDQSGKVTSCAVVLSSGVKSMDDVTCRVALKRARYKPAIGADGRRTSATFTNYAKFEVVP